VISRRTTIRISILAGLAIVAALPGCNKDTSDAAPIVVVPPKRTEKVAAGTLPKVKFVDITRDAGLTFVHDNGAAGEKLLPETMGSGVAFLDFDKDGDPDLFLVNSCPWPEDEKGHKGPMPTMALYRNDGKGHFEDVTRQAGLDVSDFGMGVAVGDYDNDDDPDLYVTAIGGGHLYRNDGGVFKDVTAEAHAKGADNWPTSAAFVDIDNDGDLDLFIGQYVNWSAKFDRAQDFQLTGTGRGRAYGRPTDFDGAFCVLLRNDGGTFVDISESAGIRVRSPSGTPVAKALGVAPYDVDGDGLVDIAVANDTVRNFLFHNLGGGKFEEVGTPAGTAYDQQGAARGGMGIDWAVVRGKNTLALAVANFANEMIALYVSDRPKSLAFADLAPVYGLGAPTQPPLKFGLFFFDYDLDGRPDLLSANGHLESDIEKVQASQSYAQSAQLYWNSGRRKGLFVPVGPDVAGPDLFRPIVGRGSAFADIDGDGDLDVVLTSSIGPARLFRNDGGNAHHWLRLRLVGRDQSNRDANGARVALVAGDSEQFRQQFPARGYLSSSEPVLTFGLGDRDRADLVTIVWPSGATTRLKDLAAGATYTVDERGGVVGTTAGRTR
jgi:hypothetical protein